MMQAKKRCGGRKGEGGFTLVEVILAAGALATALGIMFGSLVSINVMGQVAEGRTRAATVLAGVMEEIQMLDYNGMLAYVPQPVSSEDLNVTVVVEAFNAAGSAVALPLQTGTGVNAPSFPNPTEVRATILWSMNDGRIYSLTSTTLCGR